ncbi:hypothetical protein MRB53_040702 [Persea americana]|nr:hypothetical protein MRB53_040702 [Persea americana]
MRRRVDIFASSGASGVVAVALILVYVVAAQVMWHDAAASTPFRPWWLFVLVVFVFPCFVAWEIYKALRTGQSAGYSNCHNAAATTDTKRGRSLGLHVNTDSDSKVAF